MTTDPERLQQVPAEKWEAVVPELRLRQLDDLESDSVNIQCVDSSDFVVGRQVNFNGPVTIVNCTDENTRENQEKKKLEEGKIIIRDRVLSQMAAMKVQKMAAENLPDPEHHKDKPKRHLPFDINLILGLVCVGLLITAVVALAATLTTEPTEEITKCSESADDICIYSRVDWSGQPTPDKFEPQKWPVHYVIISQTHGDFCFDVDTCQKIVKSLHLNDTERLCCNFFVGSDGNAYEDRGWKWKNALEGPAAGKALQICFLGNYIEEEIPTYPQVTAVKALIRLGVNKNYLTKDYVLAASNSTAPEDHLDSIYTIIKKWPNFNDAPFSKWANETSVEEKNMTNPLSASS